ncbi:acyclic terpene utilization AtuA family protein, partial [Escherichia coli]|uniref:acyclic terpene utilization AtuA family protein n=1 Tax=Escherichia coli TaxID=562 RepID=UPI0013D42D0A
RQLGVAGLKIAAVTGDDVTDMVRHADLAFIDRAGRTSDLGNGLISANAYLGAGPIAQALAGGADIVIAGRISDPA